MPSITLYVTDEEWLRIYHKHSNITMKELSKIIVNKLLEKECK